ncbi:MAG TPA: DUF5996 family protein [Spirillospora sp.]|nr:DUF5996 family protein [Spirillospora sp.]
MSLPAYADWKDAKPALHQAAQVLNVIRVASHDPLPNALRHSLRPIPSGATTDALNFGGTLTLNYTDGAIIYSEAGQETFRAALTGKSQTALFNTVLGGIQQAGHTLDPDRARITGTEPLNLDLTQAKLYAEVQWRMFQMLAIVKASLFGPQNPLVLWPHGFDLSLLWFVDGMEERADPHLNFGFSPGTPDVGQPYVYFYTYPALPALRDHLPDWVTWTTNWSAPGGYIKYDQFAHDSQPEHRLIDTLLGIYRAASEMLKASS